MPLRLRIIAALLLMAYAVTGTSLLPGMMALLAELEGSHQSIVCLDDKGARVVLHHQQDDFTPRIADHRHCLARVLVMLCHSDLRGDHQMTSAVLAANSQSERVQAVKIRAGESLLDVLATWQSRAAWQRLASASEGVVPLLEPPGLLMGMMPALAKVRMLI